MAGMGGVGSAILDVCKATVTCSISLICTPGTAHQGRCAPAPLRGCLLCPLTRTFGGYNVARESCEGEGRQPSIVDIRLAKVNMLSEELSAVKLTLS